jgi:hypothetical protein
MRCLLALLILAAGPLSRGGAGQDFPSDFWLNPQRTAAGSGVQVIAARDVWTVLALHIHGFDRDLWDELPLPLGKVPLLNAGRLAAVRDDRSFTTDEHMLPDELPPEVREEEALYWQAVRYAAKLPPELFAKAAEPNRYLTFGHLYTEPAKYRGRIVHFSGRLVRLKQLDPPTQIQGKGVTALYEAWIFLDQPGTHPLCVIVPHSPAGVTPGDELKVRVEVDGYFFKRYRYYSGRLDESGNNIPLSTILLIAPTLTPVVSQASNRPSLAGASFFPWLISFGTAVALFMVGMTWWFRRNDRQVQARLQAVRASRGAEQAAELEKIVTPGPREE